MVNAQRCGSEGLGPSSPEALAKREMEAGVTGQEASVLHQELPLGLSGTR